MQEIARLNEEKVMASLNRRKVSLADFKIYECTKCKHRFEFFEGDESKIICPECGNIDSALLAAIYTQNNLQLENMYMSDDFHGG